MRRFAYEAVDRRGAKVLAEVEAKDGEEAIAKIRSQNLFPVRLRQKPQARKPGGRRLLGRMETAFARPSRKDLTLFTRQLSALQDAGVPLVSSIRALDDQMSSRLLRQTTNALAEDIENGETFSAALAKYPRVYDRLYVNMVRAGETGGVLDVILRRLAEFREKSARLRRKLIGAMIYPATVVAVAGLILFGILTFIVPRFRVMFDELQVELPRATLLLVSAGDLVRQRWYVFLALPFACVAALKAVQMHPAGHYALDWLKFRLPLVRRITKRAAIARFSRTLGTLLSAGVPILEALEIARETAGNDVLSRAVARVALSVREGENMSDPLRASGVTNKMVVQMVAVGEQTGSLDSMLLKVADVYDEEVDMAIEGTLSLFEPLAILSVGAAVGFIVIALFLPLIKILTGGLHGGGL